MEITIFNPDKKTPGNEYFEAIDFSTNMKASGKNIDSRPAVLFVVNNGEIKLYPAISVSSKDLHKEELLSIFKGIHTPNIDRTENYSCTLIPDVDVLKARDFLKQFLQSRFSHTLPNMEILLNEEPRGTCVYISYLAPELKKGETNKYSGEVFAYLMDRTKYAKIKDVS
ncbi:MAG: hypothetical protein ACK5N8_04060 [Alphaproteobacteria bacterium]